MFRIEKFCVVLKLIFFSREACQVFHLCSFRKICNFEILFKDINRIHTMKLIINFNYRENFMCTRIFWIMMASSFVAENILVLLGRVSMCPLLAVTFWLRKLRNAT